MKNKIFMIVALVAIILACGIYPDTVGSMQPLERNAVDLKTQQQTRIVPTITPTTDTNTATVAKNCNLRPSGDGYGQSLGVLYADTQVNIIMSAENLGDEYEGFMFVQSIEENPLDVLAGWISSECLE